MAGPIRPITYVLDESHAVLNAGREVDRPITFKSRFNGEEDLAVFDYGKLRVEVKSQPDAI